MLYNYTKLRKFDFIRLKCRYFNYKDCIVVKRGRDYLGVLFTDPYENSSNPNFSFLTFKLKFLDLDGFTYKLPVDALFLIGANDQRIIDMQNRIFDE